MKFIDRIVFAFRVKKYRDRILDSEIPEKGIALMPTLTLLWIAYSKYDRLPQLRRFVGTLSQPVNFDKFLKGFDRDDKRTIEWRKKEYQRRVEQREMSMKYLDSKKVEPENLFLEEQKKRNKEAN